MDHLAYSGVNTTVRILESSLLTRDDFEALLKAETLVDALEYLQKTTYQFDLGQVIESRDFESFLMASLQNSYEQIYPEMPQPEVVDIFSISYLYHNLKVLLKERFSGQSFTSMLIPIGRYSLDQLKLVVNTGKSDDLPPIVAKGVSEALEEFENFKRMETADIFMDTYYFRHLRYLEETLDQPVFRQLVDQWINFANLIILVRGEKQHQSRSFLQTVMSSAGSISKTKLIDAAQDHGWDAVLDLFAQEPYHDELTQILSTTTQDISVHTLEILRDQLLYKFLKDATFEMFGPLPSLAYIHAKEMEIKNLRLLLVAKDNGIPVEAIEERMRPIYGS